MRAGEETAENGEGKGERGWKGWWVGNGVRLYGDITHHPYRPQVLTEPRPPRTRRVEKLQVLSIVRAMPGSTFRFAFVPYQLTSGVY
jgi:hypothetical protein